MGSKYASDVAAFPNNAITTFTKSFLRYYFLQSLVMWLCLAPD